MVQEREPLEGQNGLEDQNVPENAETCEASPATDETGGTEVAEENDETVFLRAELNEAKAKADEYYGHLQRLQADFDNYRKRTQKEKEDIYKYASERVVESMLPVLDNFERAVTSSQTNQDFDSFAQGVEMIWRQMQNLLSQEGLTPIEAVGQPFDPTLHEAVLQVESEEYPDNTVVEELQKGYYLKDKILRPSMVKVSR